MNRILRKLRAFILENWLDNNFRLESRKDDGLGFVRDGTINSDVTWPSTPFTPSTVAINFKT